MVPADSSKLADRVMELERELEDQKKFYEQQLAARSSKYRRAIDSTSEGYLELDRELKITDCNTTILSLLGQNKKALLHKAIDTLYDKDSVFAHFASTNHLSFEANFKTATGETLPLLFKRSIIRNSEGKPDGYLVLLTDLTELKKARESLQEAQTRYQTMYKNAVQGMYQSTLDGFFLGVNPAFAKIFGFATTAELINHPGGVASLFKNPDDRPAMLSELREKQAVINYEVEMVKPDGEILWALINTRLTEDAQGRTIVEGILIDNTEKKTAEEKLRQSRERFRYLAIHDNLTDLYNTRYLYKALDQLVTKSKETDTPFSLVFLDMDNFKRVVDTYGHLNGSQMLKEVAKTLKESLEELAFGVAYGGDEFVLVLPETGKEDAVEQVRKIRSNMKNTTYLQSKDLAIQMSASFGIATYPDDAEDRDSLLALADEALFNIKSRGKDAIGTTNRESLQ